MSSTSNTPSLPKMQYVRLGNTGLRVSKIIGSDDNVL